MAFWLHFLIANQMKWPIGCVAQHETSRTHALLQEESLGDSFILISYGYFVPFL